jgi:hypothetical protein
MVANVGELLHRSSCRKTNDMHVNIGYQAQCGCRIA